MKEEYEFDFDEILDEFRSGMTPGKKLTVKGTSDGTFELETPRDRNCTFEPQTVKKHQTTSVMK